MALNGRHARASPPCSSPAALCFRLEAGITSAISPPAIRSAIQASASHPASDTYWHQHQFRQTSPIQTPGAASFCFKPRDADLRYSQADVSSP